MLPEKARAVAGRQEIVVSGNFVVALRCREEAAAEKERIREAILAF